MNQDTVRIRIQHFKWIRIRIRIQGFDDQKMGKNTADNFVFYQKLQFTYP